jgi:hypothetical protein
MFTNVSVLIDLSHSELHAPSWMMMMVVVVVMMMMMMTMSMG